MKTSVSIIAVLFALSATSLHAQEPMITNFASAGSSIRMVWDTPTNRFIIERSTSLTDWTNASFCVASSTGMIANEILFPTSSLAVAFFRVRPGLQVVDTSSTFPDSNLEAKVIQSIVAKRGPTNQVYDVELEDITTVWADDTSIFDLSGLDTLVNLSFLSLDENVVPSASTLSNLTTLTILQMEDNLLQDISFLSSLTNLTTLSLSFNQLSDISPIGALTKLEELHLGYNSISNVTALGGLTNLTLIWMHGNPIRNLAPLVNNAQSGGLGAGDRVSVSWASLNSFAQTNQIPALESYGVQVSY